MKLIYFLILSGLIHLALFPSFWWTEKPKIEIIEAEFPSVPGPVSGDTASGNKKTSAPKAITASKNNAASSESLPGAETNNAASPETGPGTNSGVGGAEARAPRILKEIFAPYPKEARRSKIEGDVVLKVIVDEDGKVAEADVLEGLGYGLDEAALTAIRQFVFSPGYKDGKVVRTQIKYRYKFRLD